MTQNGLTVIGFFCWWTIQGVKIAKEELYNLLHAAGIPLEVRKTVERSRFLKALEAVKQNYKAKGLLIRKIYKNQVEYKFGLVDESVDKAAGNLSYSHSATLTFFPNSGDIQCDRPHRAEELIREEYQRAMENYDSDDVRDIIFEVLSDLHTLSVRNRGGIYFIPAVHADVVAKLEAFVASLPGGSSYFSAAPQIDTERTKGSIYQSFLQGLKDKIAAYKTDIDSGKGATRGHAIQNRLDEFVELKKEINFYADALSFQAKDLEEQLDNLTQEVRSKLL